MKQSIEVQKKVIGYLKHLGLDGLEAQIYIFLLQNGGQSVLAISRGLKTGRTKLYPVLEKLAAKQLITIRERHYGQTYEAQRPEVLEFLVSEHESKAEQLRTSLGSVTNALKGMQLNAPTSSKIIEYHGVDGLKQMNWNVGKAKGEYRTFELSRLTGHLGQHFDNKFYDRQIDNKITSYDLTNNPQRGEEAKSVWDKKYFNIRYISPEVFKIAFEMTIYNNCVALFNYEAGDILGVEIYNQNMADQQVQVFDLLWNQAQQITTDQIS